MTAITLVLKRTIKYLVHKNHIPWNDFIDGLKIDLARANMYKSVLHHFRDNDPKSEKYQEELQYIKQHHTFSTFPYDILGTIPQPETGFDESCHLPFLLHGDKRLYFPEDWNKQQTIDYYTNAITVENILETGDRYMAKTPHRYQSTNHMISEGNILIDAGSAEGLFTLDNIDRVSKAVIIECDKKWERPLLHTFKPYLDKVEFIFKMLGGEDNEDTVSLVTILKNIEPTSTFIKMDIEGAEVKTLESSASFFRDCDRTLKISCCTYHNNGDFEKISSNFNQLNCKTECSDGYMLIYDYAERGPFFRHGIIRATILPKQ